MKKIIFFLFILSNTYAQEDPVYDVLLNTDSYFIDYTKDGIINCQDIAIWFYNVYSELYGSENVKIIYNLSPKTYEKEGLFHVFNAVLVNNQWIYIDANGYADEYLVEEVIKNYNYDPTKNIDVTSCWDGDKWVNPPWKVTPVKRSYYKLYAHGNHIKKP
jgi:hypothetical protein